jgi:hypothetical protein
MKDHHLLLDAFAEARRSWGDLVGLQPDIHAGGGQLMGPDLVDLTRRVTAHQASMNRLSDVLRSEPAEPGDERTGDEPTGVGISNRESARDEADERRTHPPLNTGSPPPEDAAGRIGEQPLADTRDRHTSHKAGSRSIAQKEAASRYPDRSMPASRKVAGAFGREPKG